VSGAASSEETEKARKRLEQVGVECTYDLLPIKQLWEEMASAKIIILRAGKHMCVPWRMIDLLCMGACIVTDSDFNPGWPQKLMAGKHYVSAGINRPVDTSAASTKEFEKIHETICRLRKEILKKSYYKYTEKKHCVE